LWYMYEVGGHATVIIGRDSRKAKALARTGRASLCAQSETAPYKYVTIEGPVVVEPSVDPVELRALAHRYLGREDGDRYIEDTEAEASGYVTARLRPERWFTTDYSKNSN
jgi:hypothetical protein